MKEAGTFGGLTGAGFDHPLGFVWHGPRFHTVRYFGVLAPAAKWRPLIVPKPGPSQATDDAAAPCAPSPCSVLPSCVGGSRYRLWAELLEATVGDWGLGLAWDRGGVHTTLPRHEDAPPQLDDAASWETIRYAPLAELPRVSLLSTDGRPERGEE